MKSNMEHFPDNFMWNSETDSVLNFFSLMIDETTDISNKKQVVLFRWVAEDLTVHEDFFGLYETDAIDAKALVRLINA